MSTAGVASTRAALAYLPAPRFVSLRSRHLWSAATRKADKVLGKRPAGASDLDLDVLAEAYSFTGESRYLAGAIERALDGGTGDGAALAAYRVGYLVRAAAGAEAVPDDDVERLLALARECAAHPVASLDGDCARLALVSYLGGIIDAGAREDAERALLDTLQSELDPEGAHLSGSPGRHAELLGRLSAVLDGGLSEAPGLVRLRMWMEEILSWMVAPDGTLVDIGETTPMVVSGVWTGASKPARMKSVYRHPAMLHAATAGALGIAPARGWRVLPQAGLAIIKDRWPDSMDRRDRTSYLVFNGSRDSGQADDLSLVWYHLGRWLLVDAGHPGEDIEPGRPDQSTGKTWSFDVLVPGRRAMAAFARSSEAHNTVTVQGESAGRYEGGFLRWGQIRQIPFADARVSLGSAIRRRSIALGADWLLIIDRVEDGGGGDGMVWFHSPAGLDVSLRDGRYLLAADGAPVAWVAQLTEGGEGLLPVRAKRRGREQGWRVGPTGRPIPAWAYGWQYPLPMTAVTLFTTSGPAEVVAAGPNEHMWEAAGSRVVVGTDEIGITTIQEGRAS